MRLAPDELRRIDELARQAGMDRTSFMVRAALGPAGEDGPEILERLGAIEARLDALEER